MDGVEEEGVEYEIMVPWMVLVLVVQLSTSED